MELQKELRVLKLIAGVTSVSAYDRNAAGEHDNNKIGVMCKAPQTAELGAAKIKINVHIGNMYSDQLACALEIKRRVQEILGDAAILAAEEKALQNLDAAGTSSSAAAASTLPVHGFSVAMKTQQLEGAERAAQRRLDALEREHAAVLTLARQELSAATAALKEHQAGLRTKRQRTEDAAQQAAAAAAAAQKAAAEAAKAAEYAATHPMYDESWSVQEWKRQETWVWRRRQVQLHENKPRRLPDELPRGKDDGPLDHERRGLIGAVQVSVPCISPHLRISVSPYLRISVSPYLLASPYISLYLPCRIGQRVRRPTPRTSSSSSSSGLSLRWACSLHTSLPSHLHALPAPLAGHLITSFPESRWCVCVCVCVCASFPESRWCVCVCVSVSAPPHSLAALPRRRRCCRCRRCCCRRRCCCCSGACRGLLLVAADATPLP